ncbi:MAG: DUF4402 domain-containing protein [Sphingomonadaceae bacterium]|nr:DUF4402 domain-containing protein [Sphingomonadaceae bacterium]
MPIARWLLERWRLAVLAVALGVPQAAIAQSASASGTAVVAAALSVAKDTDFNFGNLVAGATAGTVVLSTTGTRTATGGVILGNAGSTSAAQFTVTGQNSATFSLSIAGGVLSDGAGRSMALSSYVVKMSGGADQATAYTGTLSAGGSQTFTVGATLTVGTSATTPNGTYTTGNAGGTPVTVTVAYN